MTPFERPLVQSVLLALVAVLVVEGFWLAGAMQGLEADVSDTWHTLRGERSDLDVPVVIVAVDDATLARVEDPFVFWGPRFATTFESLRAHGTTVIGLDFLTKVSGEDFFRRNGLADLPIGRTWDGSFRRNLFQKDIVIVGSRTPGTTGDTMDLPIGEFLLMVGDARERVGLDNLPQDADGTIRRWRPVVADELVDEPGAPILSFSLALVLQHLGLPADATSWALAGRTVTVDDHKTRIVYRGPPATWPRIPMWKFLEPGALTPDEQAMLNGAIAIVGATHAGSTDRSRSPFGEPLMYGVEVHANAVGTLLSGMRVTEPTPWARRLGVGALGWLAAWLLLTVDVRRGGVALAAFGVASPVVAYIAFARFDVLLPLASPLLALGVVFTGAFGVRYLGEERERRRLRRVFERYVSDAVVNDILSSPDGLRLGGARREMTVLFTDIRGFTTLSEHLEPEEVVEMLNAWFDVACAPILDEGGVVDKFIGDAIMAVFGAPVDRPDHPRRAIAAAQGIAAAADGFADWMQTRFEGRDLPRFDIGIGVHSGAALSGNIGFERRTEYTVIGDAVNVASRLEGLTKELGCRVLVSARTLELARANAPDGAPSYTTGRRADMKVKGREEPVEVVEIR